MGFTALKYTLRYLFVSRLCTVMSSCHDITYESTSLSPYIFVFVVVSGESGNEASS